MLILFYRRCMKAGFHQRQSPSRRHKSAYELVKIENRSHKLSHVISSTESESEDSERFHFFRFRLRLHRLWSSENYPKIPKINPRFFKGPFQGAYIRRGLSTEGNLRFQIFWAHLILRSKFTVLALFHFVFEGNSPSTRSQWTYIWGEGGELMEGFLRYCFGGLIFGRVYTWRVLFSVSSSASVQTPTIQFHPDCKRRSHKHMRFSASDSFSSIFTRSYHSTLLITTPTTIPSLVKTNLK